VCVRLSCVGDEFCRCQQLATDDNVANDVYRCNAPLICARLGAQPLCVAPLSTTMPPQVSRATRSLNGQTILDVVVVGYVMLFVSLM
jgi:hypothetical protein